MTPLTHYADTIHMEVGGLFRGTCACGHPVTGRSAETASSHLLWHIRFVSAMGVAVVE